jgi:hypothetical protein
MSDLRTETMLFTPLPVRASLQTYPSRPMRASDGHSGGPRCERPSDGAADKRDELAPRH